MQKLHLGAAQCALDLGDGSERAEYVNQDYILHKLGRPHRAIGIMYTYYPHDKQWPQRISKACKDMNITFQWDYPYDDYFPFNADGQPWEQMRDIRRHGQDAALTLTLDCSLSDDELREEMIMTRLRTRGGIPLEEFRRRFGAVAFRSLLSASRRWVAAGLMEERDGTLALSRRGVIVSDEIIVSLF